MLHWAVNVLFILQVFFSGFCSLYSFLLCEQREREAREREKWEGKQKKVELQNFSHDTKHREEILTRRQMAAAHCVCVWCVPQSAGTTYGSIKNNTIQLLEQVKSANTAAAAQPPTGILYFYESVCRSRSGSTQTDCTINPDANKGILDCLSLTKVKLNILYFD